MSGPELIRPDSRISRPRKQNPCGGTGSCVRIKKTDDFGKRCSICTGEQVAGFRHLEDGRFEEIMLIRDTGDLVTFKMKYGITEEIEKFY